MSSPLKTSNPSKSRTIEQKMKHVRWIGLFMVIVGFITMTVGIVSHIMVRNTIAQENITVSIDAPCFAGATVQDPISAYCEAVTIKNHVMILTGGRTVSELEYTDPVRPRAIEGSLLQTSLYSTVTTFAATLSAAVLGFLTILIGYALRVLGSNIIPPNLVATVEETKTETVTEK